jgi:fatty-acyl-CoA synthase
MSFLRRFGLSLSFLRSYLPVVVAVAKAASNRPVDYSDLLAAHFRASGDRPVLIGETGSMTWAELDAFANRTAHWALAEGLSRGDVVAW